MIPVLCKCGHYWVWHTSRPEGSGFRACKARCKCPDFERSDVQVYEATFRALKGFIDAHGYAPSVRELGEELGLSSSATIQRRLVTLEKSGVIRRVGPRAIEIREVADV